MVGSPVADLLVAEVVDDFDLLPDPFTPGGFSSISVAAGFSLFIRASKPLPRAPPVF